MREIKKISIVVDAFRAGATAAYILSKFPKHYFVATKSQAGLHLGRSFSNLVWIGKPERGVFYSYLVPNSPTRVFGLDLKGKNVFHRTEAGAKGVLISKDADLILVTGFVNSMATARIIRSFENPKVTILPMGHEGSIPSIEDYLCASLVKAQIMDEYWDLDPYLKELRDGPGKYFFQKDQWQYPKDDFYRCLEINKFDFAVQATVLGEYAILSPLQVTPQDLLLEVRDVTIHSSNLEFLAPST